MSGATFGLPGGIEVGDGELQGGGVYKRLLVTESVLQEDPSKGQAKWFRITICGGGGGAYSNANSSEPSPGGGSAQTRCQLFPASEITWPIPITIGEAGTAGTIARSTVGIPAVSPTDGGSTSFGDMMSVLGGMVGTNNQSRYIYKHGCEVVGSYNGDSVIAVKGGNSSVSTGDTTVAAGPGVENTPFALFHTGMAGSRNTSASNSLLGYVLNNDYGHGAGRLSTNSPLIGAGSGACLIEWVE